MKITATTTTGAIANLDVQQNGAGPKGQAPFLFPVTEGEGD
jgi:hypothetical protein